jgi:hypothetical protein
MVNHIEPRRRKRYRIGVFGSCSSLLATALGLVVQTDDLIPSLIGFLRDKRMLLILVAASM